MSTGRGVGRQSGEIVFPCCFFMSETAGLGKCQGARRSVSRGVVSRPVCRGCEGQMAPKGPWFEAAGSGAGGLARVGERVGVRNRAAWVQTPARPRRSTLARGGPAKGRRRDPWHGAGHPPLTAFRAQVGRARTPLRTSARRIWRYCCGPFLALFGPTLPPVDGLAGHLRQPETRASQGTAMEQSEGTGTEVAPGGNRPG